MKRTDDKNNEKISERLKNISKNKYEKTHDCGYSMGLEWKVVMCTLSQLRQII